MALPDPEDVKMSLGDHLGELRYRLLLGLAGPVVIAVVTGFFYSRDLVNALTEPAKAALRAHGHPDQLIYLHPLDFFNAWIKVCIVTGLILGLPWLFYQLWMFIAPGLYREERKIVHRLIPGSLVLSLVGVAFMYFVLLPTLFSFLLTFAEGFTPPADGGVPIAVYEGELAKAPILGADPKDHKPGDMWVRGWSRRLCIDIDGEVLSVQLQRQHGFEPNWTLNYVMGFVTMLAFAFAIAFQLPMVLLALGWAGIVDYQQLGRARKYALLLCVIVAAIITPGSDPISLAYMSIPLYLLYEFGILLVRWFAKPRGSGPIE